MGIQLKRMKAGGDDADLIRALNDEAFPPEEHIDIEYLFGGLRGIRQDVLGIYADGEFAGFFSVLLLGRCAYIGYFAVRPKLRSRGIGSAALACLMETYRGFQIVVDFEAPDDSAPNNAMRLRRRAFYLRNGFYATGYFQYYMDTEFEITCSQPEYDRAAYERLVHAIHVQVPDYDPHHYRKPSA